MHKDQNAAIDIQHCTKKPNLIDGGHPCQIKKNVLTQTGGLILRFESTGVQQSTTFMIYCTCTVVVVI